MGKKDLSQKSKLSTQIKNAVCEVILSSTSHGFPNILRSTNLAIKLMWAFFTVLFFGLCAYMITTAIITYFNYDVVTVIRVKNDFKPYFPTVTICNLNYFTSDEAIAFIKPFEKSKVFYAPFESTFDVMAKGISKKNAKFLNNSKIFSDSKEKFIVFCEYLMEDCNMSAFKFYFHPNYGNCYQFNTGYDENDSKIPLKTTIVTERAQGLRLVLNTSVPDSLKFITPFTGAIVFIHNHTTDPMMVTGITLAPKTETNIGLSRMFYSSQPKPYSQCETSTNDPNSFSSELYKLVLENTQFYTQTLCIYQCFQREVIKNCNCSVTTFPDFYKEKSCSGIDQSICLQQVFDMAKNTDFFSDTCYQECPLECDGMTFQKTVSTTQYSNFQFEEYLKMSRFTRYFNRTEVNGNDFTAFSVYYENLGYINIEESPSMEWVDLLSNLGGIAGLFLGVSFLSFVEIIECAMQIILIFINQNKINQAK
ncbi:unnamed protein product [Brachionus calyciflorus]|uniref:Uncharacterized protein n=1 Tax=Brachionus calyciflorus TaxID=104777 RepID=A0A814HIB7_9BILA|nr:unnamed protein product [Brachionus calyciflorus]